jgi:hypothetical protein
VTSGSTLTRSAQVILTTALGLAGTSVVAFEPPNIVPHEQWSWPASSITQGLFSTTTDLSQPAPDIIVPVIDFSRSDSRWYGYVSNRLRELLAGKYDFTGFQVPSAEVIDLAREVATSLFRSDTPTPSVVPSEDGDVLYIWHKAGWDLEINVGPEGAAVWAYDRSAGKEWYGSLDELRPGVVSLLDFLAWR